MKYNINEDNQIFIQDGDGNAKYALIKNTGYQFIINKCCERIIKELLLENDTEAVLETIKRQYVNENEDALRADLNGIVNMLIIFGVIIPNENSINSLDLKDGIDSLSETEYQEASDMVKNEMLINKYNIGTSIEFYSAVNIRYQIINNNEYYFRYRDSEGRIKAIISVTPNLSSSVCLINSVIFSHEYESDQIELILKQLIDKAENSMINKVNKFRLIICENEDRKTPLITKILEKIGFDIEATFENEIDNRSIYFWTKVNIK